MKAQVLELTPTLQSAIDADPLMTLEITSANLKVKNGRMVLHAHDLISKNSEQSKDSLDPKKKQTKQSRFEAQLKEKGYRRIWVDPGTLFLSEQVKGIENVKPKFDELLERVKASEEALKLAHQECSQLSAEINRLRSRNFFQRLFMKS